MSYIIFLHTILKHKEKSFRLSTIFLSQNNMGSLKEESHANNGTKHCMFMIQITIPKIMTCILTKHMMYGYCANYFTKTTAMCKIHETSIMFLKIVYKG